MIDSLLVAKHAKTTHLRGFYALLTVAYLFVVAVSSASRLAQADAPTDNQPLPPTPLPSSARALPIPGELFHLGEYEAWVIPASITPTKISEPQPWVFFAHTLRGGNPRPVHRAMFKRFTSNGIAIAGIDVGESYGSPTGRAAFTALYEELVLKRNFSKKPCLLAQSRGGLQMYNWAAEHPDWVSAIAGIYPVGDLAHYPGLQQAHKAYGMTVDELKQTLVMHNPIDRLPPLAQAHIPILHIHGDKDLKVPLAQHSAVVAKRYAALGGTMNLIVLPEKGHSLTPDFFENEKLISFVLIHAKP